ncbi:MAG: secretin N-terminal domain-containing protein, partial [bacterium]
DDAENAPPPKVQIGNPPRKRARKESVAKPVSPKVSTSDSDEYVVLNFEDVDLNFVLQYISEIIGMNYILSTSVKGKITIQTYKKIPKDDLFSVLHTILEINGFTTVKQKNYFKVIPLAEAKQYPIPTIVGSNYRKIPPEDVPVTQIVVLDKLSVGDASKIIKPFVSKKGSVVAHKDLGIIIINDLQSNIRRLMKIIGIIDSKTEVAGGISGGQLFVYYLENVDASDLAKTLNQVFTAKKMKKNINVPLRIDRSKSKKKSRKKLTKSSPATLGSDIDLEGEIKIVADSVNNALIIKATAKDYKTILSLIKKLDIIPRQVLIEILVVDITLDDKTNMGVEWALSNPQRSPSALHTSGTVAGSISSTFVDSKRGWTFNPGSTLPFGGGFNYLLQPSTERFITFIKASADKSKAKVISSPHILAVNNKEASINIVDSVPIPQNTIGTGTNPSQSGFIYQDAGTKLTVKPKINARGLVNMEISQEVSEPVSGGSSATSAPSFKKRTAKTNAIVRSGESIVIGGLIRESFTETRNGIPYLVDIPYIGWLFGTTGKTTIRSELLMLITPHVILTEEEALKVTREFSQPMKNMMSDSDLSHVQKLKQYLGSK